MGLGARRAARRPAGKAARTAPRDALIRDSTPPRASARRSATTVRWTRPERCRTSVAVGLLALGLSFRGVLWVAVVPASPPCFSCGPCGRRPRGADRRARGARPRALPARSGSCSGSGSPSRSATRATSSCSCGRRSSGSARRSSSSPMRVQPRLRGASWPLGALSDRRRREVVIAGGLVVFALVYLGFAVAHDRLGGLAAARPVRGVRCGDGGSHEGLGRRSRPRPGDRDGFRVVSAATGAASCSPASRQGSLDARLSGRAVRARSGLGRARAGAPGGQVCQLGASVQAPSSSSAPVRRP